MTSLVLIARHPIQLHQLMKSASQAKNSSSAAQVPLHRYSGNLSFAQELGIRDNAHPREEEDHWADSCAAEYP